MWFALILSSLLACGGDDTLECIDNGQCGEFQACIADVCLDVDCLTSAVCDIGEYCHPNTNSCVDGCLENADCTAGETCDADTRTCETYGCRSTELDCPLASECNLSTGECDPVDACGNCNPQNVNSCTGNTTAYCLIWDDVDEGWCFPECGADATCPAGFTCYEDFQISNRETADVCVLDCPWFTENGYL